MKKHTKEYADSLAEKRYPETGMDYVESWQTAMRHGFSEGYLKAIEENAVPELIEAAELALSHLIYSNKQKPFLFPKGENSIEMLQNVLNKINQ